MKLVNNRDIDYQKWDNLIHSSLQKNIYAMSWYLDVVSPGWKALVNEGYTKGIPLPVVKKWGIPYIRQPYFSQQLGLFTLEKPGEGEFEKSLKGIKSKFFKIIFSGNVVNENQDKSIKRMKGVELRPNYVLSLEKSYSEIYSQFNQNRKRDLKKATKNKLEFLESNDIEHVVSMMGELEGIDSPEVLKNFITLYNTAKEKKCAKLYYAIHPETGIHSGAVFWEYGNQIIYILGATNALGRASGANTFLFNSVIEKYSKSGFTLDFEGSSVESIATFYKSLGGQPCYYPLVKYDLFHQLGM